MNASSNGDNSGLEALLSPPLEYVAISEPRDSYADTRTHLEGSSRSFIKAGLNVSFLTLSSQFEDTDVNTSAQPLRTLHASSSHRLKNFGT